MTTEELISHIRVVPDFPQKGIMFQDITTLLLEPACLKELSDRLYEEYRDMAKTRCPDVTFAGRLGEYKYYDMDAAVLRALELAEENHIL